MKKAKMRVPPEKTPLLGPMVEGYLVGEWCPTQDGSGPAKAVAVVFNLQEAGDIVLKLHTKLAVDEMISALEVTRDGVFGTDGT